MIARTFYLREVTVNMTFALPGKTPEATLRILAELPGLSIPQVATRLGKSERAIERAIRALRESGHVERIGPAKGGHWKVIE